MIAVWPTSRTNNRLVVKPQSLCINLEESALIKVLGGRGKESLYTGCVYMPTTTASVSMMDACYENLKEDFLIFKEKG